MPSIMRRMNVISRCQGLYRTEKLGIAEICPAHHSFILTICHTPGLSQEQIAKKLCFNKSTVARTVAYLEEKGYAERKVSESDKRIFLVYPTNKMLEILPRVKESTRRWNELISEGVSQEELAIFEKVLESMELHAKSLTGNRDEGEKNK